MRIRLNTILTITAILFLLNGLFLWSLNQYISQQYRQTAAKETLEAMLNAHTALVFNHAIHHSKFPVAFSFISQAFNQHDQLRVISTQKKPQNSVVVGSSEILLPLPLQQSLLQALITDKMANFSVYYKHLNPHWVTIAATEPEHPFWLYFVGLCAFNLLTFALLWLAFTTYFRKTLPTNLLNFFEGRISTRADQDPILGHLKHNVQNYFEEKNLMITALAHDIKTPLTEAMLRLEFLEDQTIAQPILENLGHIKNIISSSLEYSQPQSKLSMSKVDIVSLLETIAESYQDEQFTTTLHSSMEHYELMIEISLFRRMVGNILDNAKKYSTRCDVNIRFQTPYLIIEFVDNGLGVPQKYLSKLTTPYFRVDQSRSKQTGGSGLGLAVVKKIAEIHQGDVSFANQPNESGFTVTIRLLAG